MVLELSNIIFTDQDDNVRSEREILNIGIANTLAGNDTIQVTFGWYGFENVGTLNTDDGNDIITAIGSIIGIITDYGSILDTGKGNDEIIGMAHSKGFVNRGTLNTSDGNDEISGYGNEGFVNEGTLNTSDGNDEIRGKGVGKGFINRGVFNTDDGNDTIIGTALDTGIITDYGSTLDTGKGNDIITGIASFGGDVSISNSGTINAGDGEDSIISQETFINRGGVFLGDGNDSIIGYTDVTSAGLAFGFENFSFIGTGNGNDIITSANIIYNEGVINTGDGDDSIIVGGGINGTGDGYGIHNNGGAINMGDGNDSIIANQGFESGENSSGAWFLGEGDDYIKGFGSGDFYGGNGNDTLELTPGSYTVGIWGEAGESPIFTKGSQLMITSEFEKLKAGNTLYDFTSLTAGQIITVA
jgi:hypothetical protein